MALKFDKVKLSDEEIQAIEAVIQDFEIEDRASRDRQIRKWKRLEFLWAGFEEIWWDSVAHDWRIYDAERYGNDNSQSDSYDKNINVYRAYLETIISALSTTVPPVRCLPDDADNVNDCETAKGGDKIADLIYNYTDAPLLWIRALWIYCMQGMVAAYNYADEDKAYGSSPVANEEEVDIDVSQKVCPNCGTVLGQQEIDASAKIASEEADEYDPGDDDIEMQNIINSGNLLCPQCMIDVDPELKQNKVVVTRMTGIREDPKSRQCLEINGGLYVKVPIWARSQKDVPYLNYCYENHYTNVYEKYGEDLDVDPEELNKITSSSDGNRLYERWGRLSLEYSGEYPLNTPTERHWWLRVSAFNCIQDEDLRDKIKKKFPSGCYAIFVNDQFIKACNQSLDDHWTLTFNPLSNSIHYDPLGILLTSIQEITTTLISLEMQCIEHSVPTAFADPRVLNLEQYRNTEVVPGGVYAAKAQSGKSLSDGFYVTTTATVSPELDQFGSKIGELGQFVSGALPALYGGTQSASSRTASQYAMQGNRALQRLQLPWKMINFWWRDIFAKVIPAYIKNMLGDERYVQPNGKASYIQTVIRKSQLEGKIGSIHLEAPDGLPITLEQIRDNFMSLLQSGNPMILEVLGLPANMNMIRQSLFGTVGLEVPNENDVEKQNEEISLLLNSAPLDEVTSSIMPELMVDNHKVEAETCRKFLVGPEGRMAKNDPEKSEGYRNILLHLQAHVQMMQQLMQPAPSGAPQGNPQRPPPNNGQLKPVGAQ